MLNCVICPYCKGHLATTFCSGLSGILSCKCSDYPYLENILYLKKDHRARICMRLIKSGASQTAIAYLSLIKRNPMLLIPTCAFLLHKPNISFKKFIQIYKFFGYDGSWSEYITNRRKLISYKLSVYAVKKIVKTGLCLDFGCGIGQILPIISNKIGDRNLCAQDYSFNNLLIARQFFAPKNTLLICSDGELGLPIKTGSLKSFIATDSFREIRKKNYFIKEISRALHSNGILIVIHTLNSSELAYDNIKGTNAKKIYATLKKQKFTKISIFPDNKQKINFDKSYIQTNLQKNEGYTFFATKNQLLEKS